MVANLSKEKRKRVDVAPPKAIKFTVKKRKLMLPEDTPNEGEGNGSRGKTDGGAAGRASATVGGAEG